MLYIKRLVLICGVGLLCAQPVNAAYIFTSAGAQTFGQGPGVSNCNDFAQTSHNISQNEYYKYRQSAGYSYEKPENLYKAEVAASCFVSQDGMVSSKVQSTGTINFNSAEIKLLSESNTSFLTTSEGTSVNGIIADTLYFRDQTEPFRVDITLNYEGSLFKNSFASVVFREFYSNFSYQKAFVSPWAAQYTYAAACSNPNLASMYVCDQPTISESIVFSFYSDQHLKRTYMPDGSYAYMLGFELNLFTQAWNIGKASFNNSSWLNVSTTGGATWYTDTGKFLTTPRANISTTPPQVPAPASLLLIGCGLLALRLRRR